MNQLISIGVAVIWVLGLGAAGCSGVDTRGERDPNYAHRQDRRPARAHDGRALVRRWRHGALRGGRADVDLLRPWLNRAEARATPNGRAVLAAGRRLVITERRLFRGSCWTFADAVYAEAGLQRRARHRVFSTHARGPYADPARLRPGDFLSFVNLSYRANPHSAIFVTWLDRARNEALMLSYVGGRRVRPGDYRTYDLSRVYRIQRPR